MSESVVVTSAKSKQALAVVRALASAGYEVSAVGSSRLSQSFYSKYCNESYVVPDSGENPDMFVSRIESIVCDVDADVLLPVTAADTVVLSQHRDKFNCVVATDSFRNIQTAHNKEKTAKHAKRNGVPVPETYCPTSEKELQQIAENIQYPAVVKLRKTAASTGLRYVSSREELMSTYSLEGPGGMAVDYSRPLIQEYVSGEIHDVCVLFQDGELRKALTQKRVRMFPVSGGGGVVNKTTHRPDLIEYVEDLLSPLGWDGVAQVEFMDSEKLQQPKLIEINPKIWGTTELSVVAGVNFPRYLVDMKTGKPVDGPTSDYEEGLYFIWYEGGLLGNIYDSDGFLDPVKEIRKIRNKECKNNIDTEDIFPHIARIPQIGQLSLKSLIERWT